MGYDLTRFEGEVDEELICTICSGVYEEPLQSPKCEHTFCGPCIKEWLSRQKTCPVDRQPMQSSQLKSASRLLENLLSRLNIECDYSSFGCKTIVKLDSLSTHCNECDFNPKNAVPCNWGCGLIMSKEELKNHNCIKALRIEVQQQKDLILNMNQLLQTEQQQHKQQLYQLEEEMGKIQRLLRAELHQQERQELRQELQEQRQEQRRQERLQELNNSFSSASLNSK